MRAADEIESFWKGRAPVVSLGFSEFSVKVVRHMEWLWKPVEKGGASVSG